MSNYEEVLAVRKEISEQGLHFGSAEAENTQYLDSITGKLNTLKETWVSIISTIVKSDGVKGILDALISMSESIDGVIKKLDGMGALYPTLFGTLYSGFKGIQSLAGKGADGLIQFEQVGDSLQLVRNQVTKTAPVFSTFVNELKSSKSVTKAMGSTISQSLLPTLTNVGKTALSVAGSFLKFQAVILVIQGLHKAWQELAHGLENAEKEILNQISSIESNLTQEKQNLNYLDSIEDRYNELIKKKEAYSKIPLESRTDEQIADLQELSEITHELAQMFPELVVGYDTEGSPILLMADDMQTLKDRTQEQIDLQNELLRIQREELAENARKRVQDGEFFGLGDGIKENLEQEEAITKSLYDSLKGNEQAYTQAVLEGDNRRAKSLRKTIETQREELQNHYKKSLELYSEYISEESEIQKSTYDQIQVMDGYSNLKGDNLSSFQSFFNGLNWAGMDEGQYNKWVSSFDSIIGLAEKGSPKLKEWSDSLQLANDKYNANGNVDEYTKSLSSLAKTISSELGIDYETVFSGLEHMAKPLTEAEKSLQSFLETYNTSRYDLLNGDDFAKKLADQYQAISDVINNVFGQEHSYKANGSLTFEAVAKISNMDELPKQITKLTSQLQKNGVTQQESQIIVDLMYSLQEGNTEETRAKISQINKELESMGLSEFKIDVTTVFDRSGIEELESALKSYGTDKKSIDLLINLVGEEKAQLYKDIMENMSDNVEYNTKFIVENEQALSKLKTWEEVQGWLKQQPKEFLQTYGLEVEVNGKEETIKVQEEILKNQEALDDSTAVLSVDGTQLEGSIEDYNTLIQASAQIKDGEYKISFSADTTTAVQNVNNLLDVVKDLSGVFSKGLPTLVFKTETAQGSKNITGLKNNVNDYHSKYAGKNFSTRFSTETAQASKNVTGLKANVSDYHSKYAGKNFSTKFSTQTALASQNVTGLRNNVSSYVNSYGNKTFTTTFKVVTSYSTTGTPTAQSSGAKPSGRPSSVAEAPVSTVSEVQGRTGGMATPSPTTVASPRTSPTTEGINSPMARNYSKPIDVINSGTNYFIEVENVLANINGQLKLLEERMENSFGAKRIEYLKQQIGLLQQQRNAQSTLLNELNTYQSKLKSYLSGKGFGFDGIGNITNYHTKIIGMEKELERLEGIANKEKATDSQKKAYENYKKQFEEIKKVMDEYIQTTFTDIPNAQAEWESLGNEIENATDSIIEAQREMQKLVFDANVETLTDDFKDLEHQLNMVEQSLKHATASEQISLMTKKISLLKQQQQELNEQLNFYNIAKNGLQSYLGGVGFTFDSEGDISNYASQLEYLANNSKDFEYIQEKLEEYLKYQNETIPSLQEEWQSLGNEIKDTNKEILETQREIERLVSDAKIESLTDDFKDLEHELNILDKLLEHSSGKDKIDMLSEKIDLLKGQQQELNEQFDFYKREKDKIQSYLTGLGFNFDSDGDITNYAEQLENLAKNSDDFEHIQEKLEEYFKYQNDTLPDIKENWLDLENSIKDALKEQLNVTADMEEKITDIYKKQIEERIEAMNKETDAKVKALKEQQDAYNKYRDEVDYQEEYDEKLQEITDLQKQLDIAMKDSSLNGQKKVQELQKEIALAQKELEKLTQDKIDKNINDMFDKEVERIEEENEKNIENLENQWSESKIAEMVAQALGSGLFTDIEGKVTSLEDALINFTDETGELFGVLGATIKSELITNLEIARNTVNDLANIMKELDLSAYVSTQSARGIVTTTSRMATSSSYSDVSSQVNITAPLISIEGNVDANVVEDLRDISNKIKEEVINAIATSIR